jgi:OmcA/MtrC family decaheme c-type cytochrome
VKHVLSALAILFLSACSGSSDEGPPPAVPDEPRDLLPTQDAPGIVVEILGVGGGSGHGGFFLPGDAPRVHYTLRKKDGSRWNLHEMDFARILLSGPSFNYQRVIPEQADLAERSAQEPDGSYVYTFATPIPAQYLPPLNDTPSFGSDDGERTGEDLLDGTYTVGLAFGWDFTVATAPFVDAGNATKDVLLGGSAVLAHRAAVDQESCNRCHVDLRHHGDHWRDVTTCLLCHTSGAEDLNDPAVAGGTPDVSIDFRVLMHKLHDGRHLPSVLGVATLPSGRRDYGAPPKPYVVADSDGTVHDYSTRGFPVWPARTLPLLKTRGFSALAPEEQAIDRELRTGVSDCAVCHGNTNPACANEVEGPAQGALAYTEPSIRACYSCHDDMVPAYPFVSNFPPAGMPPQPDSTQCKLCHSPFEAHCSSSGLTVDGGHRNPLFDPFIVKGLHLSIGSVAELPGGRLEVALSATDDAGTAVPANQIDEIRAIVSGPTWNANQLLVTAIPRALLTGSQPFVFRLPELRQHELAGHSTASTGDVFTTARAPHVVGAGAATTVRVRTGTTGAASVLAAATAAPQNYVDVADASAFARDDDVVVDDGTASEEYARIQLVDGNRLWFSSPSTPGYPPGLALPHAAGASVLGVALAAKTAGTDYALDAAAGTITEVTEFGAGAAVVVTYTTEFALPAVHPLALNASPDLDETSGEWTGKSLVPGTYTLTLTGFRNVFQSFNFELNVLRDTSKPATADFLVGGATTIEPYALIDDPASCYRCHTDIWFHEGQYRGFETCIACHGQAGSEDLPRYVAANAPATTGVTVNFRTLLHQIHRGSSLADAASFQVVAASRNAYPSNFEVANFSKYQFPAMPGGTTRCAKCHGDTSTAWLEPANRNHPTEQGSDVLVWRAVCAACHAATRDFDHYAAETTGEVEGCAACHAPGSTVLPVDLAHKTR